MLSMLKFKFVLPFFFFILISACNRQEIPNSSNQSNITDSVQSAKVKNKSQPIIYKKDDVVRTALQDKAGNLWFGTSNEGVFRYDGKTFTNFSEKNGLSNNFINVIFEDKEGKMWFGTRDGLYSFDGEKFAHIPLPWDGKNDLWGDLCNPNHVLSLIQDKKGFFWLGTCGGGAYRYDGKTFTPFLANEGRLQSDSLHHNVIKSITEDAAGNLWFTSLTHGGVSRYDGETFTHFTSKDGLSYDMVFSSFQDKSGNLWFGTMMSDKGGLFRYNSDSGDFTRFNKKDGLCDNFVTGIMEDSNGLLWLCTGGKVCKFDGEKFTPFLPKSDQVLRDINFILEDEKGDIWFCGNYGSLWKYDGETLTDFSQKGR